MNLGAGDVTIGSGHEQLKQRRSYFSVFRLYIACNLSDSDEHLILRYIMSTVQNQEV